MLAVEQGTLNVLGGSPASYNRAMGEPVSSSTEEKQAPKRGRQDYPADRFDVLEPSGRVGAHRVNPRPRYVWQVLIACVLGVAVLTTAGVLWLTIGTGSSSSVVEKARNNAAESTQTVTGKLEPEATVAILEGTANDGQLAAAVDTAIRTEKLGTVTAAMPANTNDIKISAVFYTDPADEAAAIGLGKELGGIAAYRNEAYAEYESQLVVLLGADYKGPGADTVPPVAGEAAKTPAG